ncbi:MAG: rhomboid family intramembrane serine protease [Candidatus Edwardsbacteria bacterium]
MLPLKDDIPSKTFPIATISIMVVNVLVFLYELSLGPQVETLFKTAGIIPEKIIRLGLPRGFFPILTAMFLHGGFMHLFGNMLYLWIFGDNVEDVMGHFRFLIFYLLCGFIASFTHIISAINSAIPSIGASGAIAGVLGAYFLLYPKARILTLIPLGFFLRIVRLPAIIVLGMWIVIQLFYGFLTLPGAAKTGGIAWFAHIGGFFAGLLLVKIFQKRKKVRFEL